MGPSIYGLADPIQSTVISLINITVCLLFLNPDFEGLITVQVMQSFSKNICEKAVSIQKVIEDDWAADVGE